MRWPAWAFPLCVGVLAPAVCAAAPDDGASAAVRRALSKAGAVNVSEATRSADLETLRGVARELVDTRAMGRRAIGEAFARSTAAQQEEFLRLFDELMVRSYLQKLLLFRHPRFRFGTEERQGDAVIVATEVLAGDDAYQVTYEMHQHGDQWQAADIVVEGVSMTSNYSDQFASLLRDRSFDELLDLMRRKVDQFRRKDAS